MYGFDIIGQYLLDQKRTKKRTLSVTIHGDGVTLRQDNERINFTSEEWKKFIELVKNGDFDA